ncbi:hypothetical protein LINGRAHAP2_LOCUS15001, partial [Linum grandiflorum]
VINFWIIFSWTDAILLPISRKEANLPSLVQRESKMGRPVDQVQLDPTRKHSRPDSTTKISQNLIPTDFLQSRSIQDE